MPETFAIILVSVVAAGVYVYAWLQAKNPARQNLAEDLARLERHVAWLRHRLELAEREKWGVDMIHGLERELQETRARLMVVQSTVQR